jgi:hypothetical protein
MQAPLDLCVSVRHNNFITVRVFGAQYQNGFIPQKRCVVARPKSPTKSVHTAVRLPENMHRRLSASGRGLAEEIKERLEISFAWEQLDEPTRNVAAAVIGMCQLMAQDGYHWQSNTYRRATLGAAITAWLEMQVPGIPSKADAGASEKNAAWLKEGDSPEEAGRALLSLHLFCTRLDNFEMWPAPSGPSRRKSDDESKKGRR